MLRPQELSGANMPVAADPIIEMRNVVKVLGTTTALNGVSLSIGQGEAIAILGPNGAGKTTALSVMLGLRTPTSGVARLFGRDPRDPRSRVRVGAMLQQSGFPNTLKVREVIELFRRLYPQPLSTHAALLTARLESKADTYVAVLSGGERQRLFFALAIVGNPDLLFLDEPTVALDVETRRVFWAEIRKRMAEGKTIVLTTHYLDEADAMANRVVVINHGKIVADGSPREIKAGISGKRVCFNSKEITAVEIERLPGVSNITREAARWSFLCTNPEAALAQLFAHGARLTDLEVVSADLEEAVLSITNTKPSAVETQEHVVA